MTISARGKDAIKINPLMQVCCNKKDSKKNYLF